MQKLTLIPISRGLWDTNTFLNDILEDDRHYSHTCRGAHPHKAMAIDGWVYSDIRKVKLTSRLSDYPVSNQSWDCHPHDIGRLVCMGFVRDLRLPGPRAYPRKYFSAAGKRMSGAGESNGMNCLGRNHTGQRHIKPRETTL